MPRFLAGSTKAGNSRPHRMQNRTTANSTHARHGGICFAYLSAWCFVLRARAGPSLSTWRRRGNWRAGADAGAGAGAGAGAPWDGRPAWPSCQSGRRSPTWRPCRRRAAGVCGPAAVVGGRPSVTWARAAAGLAGLVRRRGAAAAAAAAGSAAGSAGSPPGVLGVTSGGGARHRPSLAWSGRSGRVSAGTGASQCRAAVAQTREPFHQDESRRRGARKPPAREAAVQLYGPFPTVPGLQPVRVAQVCSAAGPPTWLTLKTGGRV